MSAHSDQALDLERGSFVALFSCYEHPERAASPRSLVVEPKTGAEPMQVIPLCHNSAVEFALQTNRRFKHKIVLDASRNPPENRWRGLTLRRSCTFIRYEGGTARFEDGTPLVLASETERKTLYQLRRRENSEENYVYPRVTFTISPSDLIPPERPEMTNDTV